MKTKLFSIAVLLLCCLAGGCTNPWMEKILEPLFLNYNVGDSGPGGGIIFYDKGNSSDGWRYLEASPASWNSYDPYNGFNSHEGTPLSWASGGIDVPGTGTGIGTGKKNTALILAANPGSHIAAHACVTYRGGGKSDWFLPSRDELNELYNQRAVVGYPAFSNLTYWSSSQYDAADAWVQIFIAASGEVEGSQEHYGKNSALNVRPIRAF